MTWRAGRRCTGKSRLVFFAQSRVARRLLNPQGAVWSLHAGKWWVSMMRRASIEMSLSMLHLFMRWHPEPWRLMAWLKFLLN
jgi:hypothetical protein